MLEGNRFETELPLQPGSNSLAIAATDASGNRSNSQFQVDLPSANDQPLLFTDDDDGNLTSDGIRSYSYGIYGKCFTRCEAIGQVIASCCVES